MVHGRHERSTRGTSQGQASPSLATAAAPAAVSESSSELACCLRPGTAACPHRWSDYRSARISASRSRLTTRTPCRRGGRSRADHLPATAKYQHPPSALQPLMSPTCHAAHTLVPQSTGGVGRFPARLVRPLGEFAGLMQRPRRSPTRSATASPIESSSPEGRVRQCRFVRSRDRRPAVSLVPGAQSARTGDRRRGLPNAHPVTWSSLARGSRSTRVRAIGRSTWAPDP